MHAVSSRGEGCSDGGGNQPRSTGASAGASGSPLVHPRRRLRVRAAQALALLVAEHDVGGVVSLVQARARCGRCSPAAAATAAAALPTF